MEKLHLLCNAHIDPIWQWEFEEGAGTVLSTFRAACDFCDEFDGFVFNHNEAMIYQWVEQYDPALFERIRAHVKSGKWHIMGGWYLQPDCNMPCGESIIRQIETGRKYFRDTFGIDDNRVVINFDAFGHSRGLVQILEKAGYEGYICFRPGEHEMHTPEREYLWEGFNGSSILVHRADSYNTPMGKAHEKIEKYLAEYSHIPEGLVLWGVGNHGGGPSREDLRQIERLREKYPDIQILHSTPEAYIDDLLPRKDSLYVWDRDMGPTFPGCYTSQARIKQTHRALENELYLTEKMCTHAHVATGLVYPEQELAQAQEQLLFAQFHDILPGSSIQAVEEQGLQIMHHGLNLLRNLKARAFFALGAHEKAAAPGTYPVLVYNPHPFPVTDVFEVEFMLADQNWSKEPFVFTQVYRGDEKLPTQCVQERSHVPIQWRKRVAFRATLAPFSMNRFDIREELRPFPVLPQPEKEIRFENERMRLVISKETGLIESYRVDGIEYAGQGFGTLEVFGDNEDPWGMADNLYSSRPLGRFQLVKDPRRAAQIAACAVPELAPVRVIEWGDVLVKVEAIMEYQGSTAIVQYEANRFGTEVRMNIRLINGLKDRMVKLMLPLGFRAEAYRGKTMFGINDLDMTGVETVSQEYVWAQNHRQALSVFKTGCYGGHFRDNALALTLLRGAAYCAHPIEDRRILPPDRFSERMDQGERLFSFVLKASATAERVAAMERESQVHQQPCQIVCYFPGGDGRGQKPLMTIDHPAVSVSALRKWGDGCMVRLFNGLEEDVHCILVSEVLDIRQELTLKPFEIVTLQLRQGYCDTAPII